MYDKKSFLTFNLVLASSPSPNECFSFQEYLGNNDANTIVSNDIFPPIVSKKILVLPDAWHSSGIIGFRFELYGCYEGKSNFVALRLVHGQTYQFFLNYLCELLSGVYYGLVIESTIRVFMKIIVAV